MNSTLPGALHGAIAEAASLLRRSRAPVIGGLMTDIAGAEAAVALAEAIRGTLDHAHAGALLRDLGVMREAGWIVVTPPETRARADTVLIVGSAAPPAILALDVPPTLAPERPRNVWRLCSAESVPLVADERVVAGTFGQLPSLLATLRALAAGRPVVADGPAAPGTPLRDDLDACAEALRAARYGVVIWSADTLDPLAIEMLCGLIDDLNATTRFAGLPLAQAGNAEGVAQAIAWRTGYPQRVGFGRGARSMILGASTRPGFSPPARRTRPFWIDALDASKPTFRTAAPVIALAAPGVPKRRPSATITITVGRPGVDHDAVLHDPTLGALVSRLASAPSDLPSVAAVLDAIREAIGAAEVAAC